MTTRSRQLLLIVAALALTVGLYLAPKKNIVTTEPTQVRTFDFESLLTEAKASLKRQEVEAVSALEERQKKEPGNLMLIESLGKRWDEIGIPAISAHYYELIAKQKPDEKNWINAAYRYYDAFKMTQDSMIMGMMIQNAIRSYEKVIEISPENLNAKTDLGLCYAEGTQTPMKGIMMLREVVGKNPEHENAQFNLGILSMKSGQYEKATERFEKVLSINPKRKEMYLFIGRAYMLAGNNAKAIENFERLKKETTDAALVAQANNYINQSINH